MKIDNFEQIKRLLDFPNSDVFYFAQIIGRKKENPELGSNNETYKTYYITSVQDLDKYKAEMVLLAEHHNARVMINLNKRSFERIAFQNLRKVTDIIMNKDYKSVSRAYSATCGVHMTDDQKK